MPVTQDEARSPAPPISAYLEAAAQLRSLAADAQWTAAREQFVQLAALYEKLAAHSTRATSS
jgi:hypothetical protein